LKVKKEIIDNNNTGGYRLAQCDLNSDGTAEIITIGIGIKIIYQNQTIYLDNKIDGLIDIECFDVDKDNFNDLVITSDSVFNPYTKLRKNGAVSWLRNPRGTIQKKWQEKTIVTLDAPHRTDIVSIASAYYLILSTLYSQRGNKLIRALNMDDVKNKLDPGYLYIFKFDYEDKKPQLNEIFKSNGFKFLHGMRTKKIRDSNYITQIGSYEGLTQFQIKYVKNKINISETKLITQSMALNGVGDSQPLYSSINKFKLLTIEPWHGDNLNYYEFDGKLLVKTKLNSKGLKMGHDFLHLKTNSKYSYEVLSCHKGEGGAGIILHRKSKKTNKWSSKMIDKGIGCESVWPVTDSSGQFYVIDGVNNKLLKYDLN